MHPNDKGQLAEYLFAGELLRRGITAAWPVQARCPYDLLVERQGKQLKVQVKTSSGKGRQIRFCVGRGIKPNSKQRIKYTSGDAHVFALYVLEFDLWYLIPFAHLKQNIKIRPTDPACPWARFKNAWRYVEYPAMKGV